MRLQGWDRNEQITAEIEKKAMDRLERAGQIVAAQAKRNVPFRTGKLQKSIRVTRLKGDPKQNIRVYAGNRLKDGAFYAHMVEKGTIKMPAKPFLRPALNSTKSMILTMLRNG